MDERGFVEQKRQSWQDLSDALEAVRKHGPGRLTKAQISRLASGYRTLLSDLAYARSQRASDGLVTYLNELAARANGVLYSAKPARLRGTAAFILREFPALFRSTFGFTLCAAVVFFGAWAIPASNPEIAEAVFPAQIARSDSSADAPTVLESVDPGLISSFIMANNIREGIYAFAGGVTAGTFTFYRLAYNGLVIGAIASKASEALGPGRFWPLILPHGIVELTAIFICGGAGFLIAAAIIAPGNLRRADALRLAGSKAVRLFAGTALMFVTAAVIEGFVTPSSLSPEFKLAFAGLTAAAMLGYFTLAGRAARAA